MPIEQNKLNPSNMLNIHLEIVSYEYSTIVEYLNKYATAISPYN